MSFIAKEENKDNISKNVAGIQSAGRSLTKSEQSEGGSGQSLLSKSVSPVRTSKVSGKQKQGVNIFHTFKGLTQG